MFEFGATEAVGPKDSTEVHLAFQMFSKWLEGTEGLRLLLFL